MKSIIIFFFLLLLTNCSFDNKTGIWENENNPKNNQQDLVFKDFKKISSSAEVFDKNIPIDQNFKFKLSKPSQNNVWTDIFYEKTNNLKNFRYNDNNIVLFKSKRLSKYKINEKILFDGGKLILNDTKGNIIIYSINTKKIIKKFNFYKKKFRGIEKNINLIIEQDVIYISDNIGYIYAYDYNLDKVLWAKNHKVPFRSNIKLFDKNLVTSNQNNDLLIFDKVTGNIIKLIPSEETIINNFFLNNISISNKEIYFLNTYGSLYSVDIDDFKLNWFQNINNNFDTNLSNLFNGSEIVNYKDKILVSSNESFYVLNSKTGDIINKINFSPLIKPIINNQYIFLITKNNLLVSMNSENGKIIYSYNIEKEVAEFVNSKKKSLEIKNFMLINNEIFLFLKNSYLIKFSVKGNIKEILKLPSSLNTEPIIINDSLLYLNKKNKLMVID